METLSIRSDKSERVYLSHICLSPYKCQLHRFINVWVQLGHQIEGGMVDWFV